MSHADTDNGWGCTFHRHFASNEIHRDGGPECSQQGSLRRVYVFDPDVLAVHDAELTERVRAEQREADARIAESEIVRSSYSARADAAAAIREAGKHE
jgi:hypothetical protein